MALVSYNSMRHSSLLYVARSGLAVCMSMSVDGRSWSSTSAEPCSTGWDSYDIGWRGVICNREGGRVTMIDHIRMGVPVASIRGNVSGWAAMTQATSMCVHQRHHAAYRRCVLVGWLIGAHMGEGAAQTPVQYPGERRRLRLGGNDPGYTNVRAPAPPRCRSLCAVLGA